MSLPSEIRLKNLTPKRGRKTIDLAVCEGLSVHVRETAAGTFSRSYVFRYRFGDKIIKESLGSLNDVSLSAALMMCNERKRYVLQGQRPAQVIHKTIEKVTNLPLFSDAVRLFVLKRQNLAANTKLHTEQALKLLAPLMSIPLASLTAEHGRQIFLPIIEAGKIDKALNGIYTLYGIAETAIDAGYIEENPFTRLRRLVPKKPRVHYTSVDPDDPEGGLRFVLHHVMGTRYNFRSDARMYFVMGLFTLLRPAEVAGLLIEDLNLKKKILKCRHTKTRPDGWIIPLNPELTALCKYIAGERKSGKFFSGALQHNLNFFFRDRKLPMTCHGWRAAGAAWMVHNGISVDIAEACLTHKIGNSVTAAYIRTDFPEERAAAMRKWHQFLVSELRAFPPFDRIFK